MGKSAKKRSPRKRASSYSSPGFIGAHYAPSSTRMRLGGGSRRAGAVRFFFGCGARSRIRAGFLCTMGGRIAQPKARCEHEIPRTVHGVEVKKYGGRVYQFLPPGGRATVAATSLRVRRRRRGPELSTRRPVRHGLVPGARDKNWRGLLEVMHRHGCRARFGILMAAGGENPVGR